jgi:hypothetical protein
LEVFLEQTSPLLIQRDSGELFKCEYVNTVQTIIFPLIGSKMKFLLVTKGDNTSSYTERREDTATLFSFCKY